MKRESVKQEVTERELSFALVMERLKTAFELSTDRELAQMLGMSTSNFANRKRADSIPYELLVPLCFSLSVNIDWVCTGRGSPALMLSDKLHLQPGPIEPVLLGQVMAELESPGEDEDRTALARKIGYIAAVVYNQVAPVRDPNAQAAKLRDIAKGLVTSAPSAKGAAGDRKARR